MPPSPGASIDADNASPLSRVVIEGVEPEIDCGAFPAKGVAGDPFVVEADVFGDSHDALRCVLLHRTERQRKWREVEMEALGNDRWRGSFTPDELGTSLYTVLAWIDRWGSWVRDLRKRVEADQDVRADLRIGAGILDRFAGENEGVPARRLSDLAERLRDTAGRLDDADGRGGERSGRPNGAAAGQPDDAAGAGEASDAADPSAADDADVPGPAAPAEPGSATASPTQRTLLDELVADLEGDAGAPAREHDPRLWATRYGKELEVVVDRERAVYSAWYEFFPRSTGPAGEHGTFRTAEAMLPYVAEMGFDVVYLPPIHPAGRTKRKGPNNRPAAEPGDHGSPWAIGAQEGGHTAIHPDLGTPEDFRRFRERAEELGLEVALDVAFQVSPDHPWVEEHPEWFRTRPDGSIQYAENPPKKYEDIYPINFETEAWESLWKELKRVFDHWIGQGVKIFRVDNPHTKSLRFWAWCISEIRRRHPEVIFLSEAFTRPRVMYYLAKLGFTQSYTYFAWRDDPRELREYMEELTRSAVRHYFRPNFWPNTPDILTETLQHGGRAAFMMRHVLAATLTANYGIYGPAFELLEHRPRSPGSEEYLDSEKYQLREWDLEREDSLRHFIARVNRIRTDHRALHRNDSLHFHDVDNESMLAYSKRSGGYATPADPPDDALLCVVTMDPYHRHSGWVDVDLPALGLPDDAEYEVHDLLSDARFSWSGRRNYVELDPRVVPAHIFRIIPRTAPDRHE